jgi:hypothetical protein
MKISFLFSLALLSATALSSSCSKQTDVSPTLKPTSIISASLSTIQTGDIVNFNWNAQILYDDLPYFWSPTTSNRVSNATLEFFKTGVKVLVVRHVPVGFANMGNVAYGNIAYSLPTVLTSGNYDVVITAENNKSLVNAATSVSTLTQNYDVVRKPATTMYPNSVTVTPSDRKFNTSLPITWNTVVAGDQLRVYLRENALTPNGQPPFYEVIPSASTNPHINAWDLMADFYNVTSGVTVDIHEVPSGTYTVYVGNIPYDNLYSLSLANCIYLTSGNTVTILHY